MLDAPVSLPPHVWDDPSVPITVPNPAGRRATVDVSTATGSRPPGFAAAYDIERGEVTVCWSGLLLDFADFPALPPAGPLTVVVITPN